MNYERSNYQKLSRSHHSLVFSWRIAIVFILKNSTLFVLVQIFSFLSSSFALPVTSCCCSPLLRVLLTTECNYFISHLCGLFKILEVTKSSEESRLRNSDNIVVAALQHRKRQINYSVYALNVWVFNNTEFWMFNGSLGCFFPDSTHNMWHMQWLTNTVHTVQSIIVYLQCVSASANAFKAYLAGTDLNI